MANTITQTTLSAAMNIQQGYLSVVSATNIAAPTFGFQQKVYIIDPNGTRGELMQVIGAANGTFVPVARLDMFRAAHASGSIVIIAPVDPTFGAFQGFDPVGTPPSGVLSPWVNVVNGNQWLVGVGNLWVPGFNNVSQIRGLTAAVASAAGLITPSGPLFHVTGTAAITGFNIPVGFSGGKFSIIPDGVFTWTTANNIALAGTAVVGKELVFTYDSNTALFYPSYTA